MSVERTLERVRKLCVRLPRVSERLSHGAPTFFIDETKSFVTFVNNHHGDGILGVWCAAPEGAQAALAAADPERYYRPAYVGARGWVGVRLDGKPDWKALTAIVNDAYDAVAPRRASVPKKSVTAKKP